MIESLITTLDKFTPEILVILSGLLVITTTLFLWLWFANRRTYNLLRHQLPASVVKQYLDTVIQNSNTLKTALFRGGTDDLNSLQSSQPPVNTERLAQFISSSTPQMLATADAGDSALREQLQQKLSELAALQSQLASAQNAKRDLESGLAGSQARIKELEDLLAKAGTAGGADSAISGQLEQVTKERDALKTKLKEYEIIEDDLADLKRLQQENIQLKRALGEPETSEAPPMAKGQAAVSPPEDLFDDVPTETAAPEVDEEKTTEELEQFLSADNEKLSEPEVEASEAQVSAAPSEEKTSASEKTPEDLLSEFEKMLG